MIFFIILVRWKKKKTKKRNSLIKLIEEKSILMLQRKVSLPGSIPEVEVAVEEEQKRFDHG